MRRKTLLGYRRGENHPRALFTDREVELMRLMHERDGYGCRRLAKIFGGSLSQIKRVLRYEQRGP